MRVCDRCREEMADYDARLGHEVQVVAGQERSVAELCQSCRPLVFDALRRALRDALDPPTAAGPGEVAGSRSGTRRIPLP